MAKTYILIDINSDLEPIAYPVNTDDEVKAARIALRDAGLAYEFIWVGDPTCPDSYKTDAKLFASAQGEESAQS